MRQKLISPSILNQKTAGTGEAKLPITPIQLTSVLKEIDEIKGSKENQFLPEESQTENMAVDGFAKTGEGMGMEIKLTTNEGKT